MISFSIGWHTVQFVGATFLGTFLALVAFYKLYVVGTSFSWTKESVTEDGATKREGVVSD